MTLLKKPKREDFNEQRGVLKLFHKHGFDAAERDYYKRLAEHQDQYLFSIASGNVDNPRAVAQACLDAIRQTEEPT